MEAIGVNKRDAVNQIRQFGSKFDRLRNAAGGSDFWESGVLRPDRVLADLVHIFHPELSETDELYYYRQLE